MTRRIAFIALVVAGALALGAGVYFGARPPWPGRRGAAAALRRCSRCRLPDVAGKQEPLEQWRGKVLVVNFWATWCVPCREEMPEFVRAQTGIRRQRTAIRRHRRRRQRQGPALRRGNRAQLPGADRRLWRDGTVQDIRQSADGAAVHRRRRSRRNHRAYSARPHEKRATAANRHQNALILRMVDCACAPFGCEPGHRTRSRGSCGSTSLP